MTETEWLTATDPTSMLQFLRGKAGDRKLRLFAVGCCRLIAELITDPTSRDALKDAEQFADRLVPAHRIARYQHGRYFESRSLSNTLASAVGAVGWAVNQSLGVDEVVFCCQHAYHAHFLHAVEAGTIIIETRADYDVVGQTPGVPMNAQQSALLRDIFGNPFRPVTIDPVWRTSTVLQLARQMYDTRDFTPLPILADALQDAGCDNPDVLTHCRDGGLHVKGCWVIDLLLGKS